MEDEEEFFEYEEEVDTAPQLVDNVLTSVYASLGMGEVEEYD